MKNFLEIAIKGNLWFYVLSGMSIALIIASFLVPPVGVVDPSVLASVGEIFAFAALYAVIKAVDNGTKATVKHGNTELNVGGKEDNE